MEYVRFLHVLGAIAVGYYILLPFIVRLVVKLQSESQTGYVKGLIVGNRIGQYILIAQFLTGGYLISQKPYTVVWMVIVIVVFVLLAALAGMMSKPLKQMMNSAGAQADMQGLVGKTQAYSLVIFICFIVLVYLMAFPWVK